MKKLSVGISDFKELIQEDYIYVDKTEYIYKLIKQGKYYFLSRPRRFGKSLLISTLEYLFKGEKELFRGLYIQDKLDWNQTYPVLRIDFAKDIVKKEDYKKRVILELEKNYVNFEIKLRNGFNISYFSLLNFKRNINLYYSLNLKELAKELNSSNMYLELIDNNLFSWRFNIRVNFNRNRLLKKLFDNGVFVSRLFPVVANLFLIDPIFKSSFNNSSKHWLKVINIFNNHLVIEHNFLPKNNIYLNSNYIEKFVKVIGNFVKGI